MPRTSHVIVVQADAPWYTSELAKEKRLRRKLEHNMTKLAVDKERLDIAICSLAKQDYRYDHIDGCPTGQPSLKQNTCLIST